MTEHALHAAINANLSAQDARTILHLRLLIARAANSDSLAWWDDDSFTLDARFVLERIFPFAPALAARSLALHAATARHAAACAAWAGALHLYRLDADNQDRLALRFEPLLCIPVLDDPIPSTGVLKQHLHDLLGEPAAYTVVHRTGAGGLQIEIPPVPRGVSPLLHRARTLAWAYLEGAPGQPAIPYFVE